MDFLAEHCTILGLDFQIWMPLFFVPFAIYVVYLWKTGQLR